jgi:hypothetical protein
MIHLNNREFTLIDKDNSSSLEEIQKIIPEMHFSTVTQYITGLLFLYPLMKKFEGNIYMDIPLLLRGVYDEKMTIDIATVGKLNNLKLFGTVVELIKDKKMIVEQVINQNDYTWIRIIIKKGGNNRNKITY